MHTHSSKTIPAPGLAEMLAHLEHAEVGHPGEGWFCSAQIADVVGINRANVKVKCDKLVKLGTYESCQRRIGRNITTFYRLKGKCPDGVQQGRTMTTPCGALPRLYIPRAKKKRAGE